MTTPAILKKSDAPATAAAGLRDLVVHVDDGAETEGRVAFAAAFARAQGAHLVAVATQTPPYIPAAVRAEVGETFFEAWRKTNATATARQAERAAVAGRAEGVEIEFRTVEGQPEDTLLVHARHADLTILSQAAGPAAAEQTRTIEALLFGSGRPILLVPAAGRYTAPGRHVLVAWNGSREAARAVADAMPVLQRAQHVTVLSADPAGAARRVPGADIALHLARHGVKVATSTTYAGDIGIGDALLNRATDLGADMLVMGGYGHSRTREAIFGGATRHVLEHMTLPVFMSH